ncbi:hypothetical protein DE146DRAFT_681158 [Phaeosphaeria sp. MPI-PUGE-AT-0046c]|nr:hypothetical protein DE146DRAFT_681158 [Phaeosphaeria sp. MPI-PUGE-AT-0046c]
MYNFTTLAIQSWTFYAISISLIFSRLIFRRITLGHFKNLQADDWLMLVVLVPYTASIVLANQVGHTQTSQERKFRYVLEEMQIITTWLVKACLLILYWRIFPVKTSFTKRRTLQAVAAFCSISFLIVQASLMLWCKPTEAYWDMSTTNSQCTSYHSHSALLLALSIPTTLTTMLLPVPFIPTPRRLLLSILLLLGTLVLIASIVSRALILTSHQNSESTNSHPMYLSWYTTESTLSIIFANLPFLTSLVVTAAPARMRYLSSQLALAQLPRSRRESPTWDDINRPELRTKRFNSTATTIVELTAITHLEKGMQETTQSVGNEA